MDSRPEILIVDDTPACLCACAKILADLDATIVKASSGNEALRESLYHDFDLAVIDVKMPEMDGYELAHLLRADERPQEMPIIFLSAVYTDEFHIFKGYESGAVDFIIKPCNPRLLASKVKAFLALSQQRRRLEALICKQEKINLQLHGAARKLARELDTSRVELEVREEDLSLTQAQLEESQSRMADDLAAMLKLQTIAAAYAQTGDVQLMLGEVLEAAIDITRAELGTVQLVDPRSQRLTIVAQHGFEPPFLDFWRSGWAGQSACDCALAQKERVIVEEVISSSIFAEKSSFAVMLAAGVRALQATPLLSCSGALLGVLSTHYRTPCRPDHRDLRLLDLLVRQTADILQQAQTQEALKAANEKLEQRVAERTAALEATNRELEAFAYSVSHDLRAPLRAVTGFSRLLMKNCAGQLDEKGRLYLQHLHAGGQKMDELIDAILALSKLTRRELKPGPVNLSQAARETAGMLRNHEPEREVELVIADGLIAQGDQAMLRAVIDNLIGNAWKYTAKRPHARIELGARELEGERVYFVRDNGAGFDMANSGRLFTAFQRLHREVEFPGIGIGLATVQRIIHRHGGRIWAEGEKGVGATFFFTLGEAA